jgi:3-phenylpropionate/trans-cinnamate dioxygenase ferredoxin component
MRRVLVADFADLPLVGGHRVEIGSAPIALFRVGDSVYALADRCSHAEASLSEGEVFGTEVECPRHGAVFDLATGKALSLPATRPVAVLPTVVEDGNVFVEWEAE